MRYTNPRLLYLLYFTHALLNSVLLNDLEWLSKIFNDKKRRAVSLRQLSFLLVWSLSGAKQPSYKHFPSVGALSHKFSIAPSDETADRTKNVGGAKMVRNCSITMRSIMGHAPAVDEKVWCFFCLSRFGMTKFVIAETLRSGVIFKTVMVSLHRGRFAVVHLYSTFSVNPQHFPLGANLYEKVRFFAIFEAVNPHF